MPSPARTTRNSAAAAEASERRSTVIAAAPNTATPASNNSTHATNHPTYYIREPNTPPSYSSRELTQIELFAGLGVIFMYFIWWAMTAAPFVWLFIMHKTGGSSIILTLFGFLTCCCWVSDPLQDLYRQSRQDPAPVILLYTASLAAPFVWLWKLYWMEGSSTIMSLIGLFGCCCFVYKPVTGMLRDGFGPAVGGETLAG